MPAAELDGERPAERQPGHVRLLEAEAVEERGQAVGVAGHAERLRRIGRSTRPRRIPRHDRELVRELVDLAAPADRAVTDIAMEENEGWSVADTFVGDSEAANVDCLHEVSP